MKNKKFSHIELLCNDKVVSLPDDIDLKGLKSAISDCNQTEENAGTDYKEKYEEKHYNN